MPVVRRSTRVRAVVNYTADTEVSSYPDGPPANTFEKTIALLNLQAFPRKLYAVADDVLVFSLFATKKNNKLQRYRSLKPAFLSETTSITAAQGTAIAKECLSHICEDDPTLEQCAQTAKVLKEKFPEQFSADLQGRIITQYVLPRQTCLLSDSNTPYSLLLRYFLLHSVHSNIRMEKVSFDGGSTIEGGLKASKLIEPSTYLLCASSSMSSDLWDLGGGVSVIESSPRQKRPHGKRLLLGPLRFANHDCKPNCQVGGLLSDIKLIPLSRLDTQLVSSTRPYPRCYSHIHSQDRSWRIHHSCLHQRRLSRPEFAL